MKITSELSSEELEEKKKKALYENNETTVYTIKAQDQLIDATRNSGNTDLNSVIPNDINKTGGLPNVLKIFDGAKVIRKV